MSLVDLGSLLAIVWLTHTIGYLCFGGAGKRAGKREAIAWRENARRLEEGREALAKAAREAGDR